jgi:hypothetical protein
MRLERLRQEKLSAISFQLSAKLKQAARILMRLERLL